MSLDTHMHACLICEWKKNNIQQVGWVVSAVSNVVLKVLCPSKQIC